MKKVLHIGQMIGGLDVYIRNTIQYNKDEGIEYVIATGKNDKHNPVIRNGEKVCEYSIDLYRSLNPFKDFRCIIQLLRIIRKEHPDIIHCHSAKGGMLGRIVGWITSTETLYTPHAFSYLSTQSSLKCKVFKLLERATRFNTYLLACSESEQLLGINEVGYNKDRALSWNNSVPDAGKLIKRKDEGNYVCYIGRPSYQKNSLFFVDVIKGVHEQIPDVKFLLLGVGYFSPDLETLKTKLDEYGLNDVVELKPWLNHEETVEYIQRSKLYLTCSRYEGLPLAVIEAMSLGKAVIASDVLGNKDCVVDGKNGYLLPLEKDTFVSKTVSLLQDDYCRHVMGAMGREMFIENFFIENRINKLTDIYLDITKR